MAKSADAADLKSADLNRSWGFKSPSGHQRGTPYRCETYRRINKNAMNARRRPLFPDGLQFAVRSNSAQNCPHHSHEQGQPPRSFSEIHSPLPPRPSVQSLAFDCCAFQEPHAKALAAPCNDPFVRSIDSPPVANWHYMESMVYVMSRHADEIHISDRRSFDVGWRSDRCGDGGLEIE